VKTELLKLKNNMKVVLTAAVFDILHEGHLNLLRKMRESGDYVVVVLHDDASVYKIKGKIPIQDIEHRVRNLKITGLVDKVLITKSIDPADQFIKVIKKYPDLIFMRASDNKNFPGKWLIDGYGIPIEYVKYTKGVSSSLIRKRLCK
jgi:cytidyltransferase-like protein